MNNIRPRDVRKALKNSNQKSSPGPDGLTLEMLHQLTALHKPLATLFNKVLQNGAPPATWGESIIKLFHKKGPATDPTNYRPIALSNTVAKTFHLILSHRTTQFLTENEMIDPSVQKAFLPGVSGTTEHNFMMSEIIKHIKHMKKTLHITFFDLADAFGSVPHDMILHSLKRNHFPQEEQEYFNNF